MRQFAQIFSFFLALNGFSAMAWSEPANLALLKNDIRQYHDSGDYDRDVAAQVAQAKDYLLEQVTHLNGLKNKKRLAIVLDIDETSLSNYPNLIQQDFANNQVAIHAALLKGNDPAIRPTLDLYNTARKHGVDVFFITGRNEAERASTERNLIEAGYTKWTKLYVKPENYHNPSAAPFKSTFRKEIEAHDYTIILSLGDQYSDLTGGHALKGFKLPNPFYHIP